MKTAKNLLIPLIIMILLGIGVVVFFAVDKNRNAGIEPTSVSRVDLLYISPVDVSSVSVQHRDSGVTVRVDKKTSGSGSDVYSYSGSDRTGEGYSQTLMGDFVDSLTSFVGCVPISPNGSLAEYGLDNPAFKVTITKTDGSSSAILIGNLSPGKETCYVCAPGSTAVYYVNAKKHEQASKVGNDLLDRRVAKVSLSAIETVRFERRKDSVDLYAGCVYDSSAETATFKFSKPFEVASSAYFDRLIENICDLEAEEYEDPTNDNVSRLGLTNPAYTVTLMAKNASVFKFEFSATRSGYYYGRLNGSGKIFKVANDKLDNLESPVLVLISSYVFNDTCDNVLSIECYDRENKFVFKLEVPKEKTFSDAEATATLDGRNAKVFSSSGRSYAAMLYESIFCIDIGGVDEAASISSSAVPAMTITIFDRNHSSVVYTFFKRNEDSYYVCKNGVYTKFYVFNRELYNDGGTDTYDYGIWPAYDLLTKAITNAINGVYDIPK